VDIAAGKNSVNMAGQKVVAELVCNAEILEAYVFDVGGVGNGERVADTDQHPRDTGVGGRLRPNLYVVLVRDREWIDG
jgi:hypothetical protein